jgi:hypothetical protein
MGHFTAELLVQKLKAEIQGKRYEVWLAGPYGRLSQRPCYWAQQEPATAPPALQELL